MQCEAERGTDDRQVGEIDGTDERVRRTIEIERQKEAAGSEDAVNLRQRPAITGTLRMP